MLLMNIIINLVNVHKYAQPNGHGGAQVSFGHFVYIHLIKARRMSSELRRAKRKCEAAILSRKKYFLIQSYNRLDGIYLKKISFSTDYEYIQRENINGD